MVCGFGVECERELRKLGNYIVDYLIVERDVLDGDLRRVGNFVMVDREREVNNILVLMCLGGN